MARAHELASHFLTDFHSKNPEMTKLICLSALAPGSRAVVREFPTSGPAGVRLREMGLLVGTPLTLVRAAPLGDPIEIKVRGYFLTLRKSEADHILVEAVAETNA